MKKPIRKIGSWILLIAGCGQMVACQQGTTEIFTLSDKSDHINLYVEPNAPDLIKWAAEDLALDLAQLAGKEATVIYTDSYGDKRTGIYIGCLDDALVSTFPADYQLLENEWEMFIIQKHQRSLFIVGSDIRGTVYGIFDVAERLGISPWKWWADVATLKKENISLELPGGKIKAKPCVQYRGIFLNDEDWGLQPWAAKTYEPETKDIGPKTYEKIFQLLLRLKANTLWPAMHPSTQAFFSIPGNKEMAEKYHINIGSSHAEPMLRNNVGEWDEEAFGAYNYVTNRKRIRDYWEKRISEIEKDNYIITMGMRGIHDSGMEGTLTTEEKAEMLETIINDQREILKRNLSRPVERIPQVFVPYKEVLDLYEQGMKVPEDITLVWPDDNYGYIRRLSNQAEQKRPGGSGVYYHLSYWGRPHDYLWLSTTQPGLIWYEMSRAYQNGAKKIWIANAGDIKPAEYTMEFFLDLAWDVENAHPSMIKKHLEDWATREFGREVAQEISTLMNEYYRLALLRKPEYMGWSQTEPRTSSRPTAFTLANDNELERRIKDYESLYERVEHLKTSIPDARADAFFQLVEYPVKGAALMNFKFLYAQKAYLTDHRVEKLKFSSSAREAYEEIVSLTDRYNNDISEGKWKYIMDMAPRNLAAYQMPDYHMSDKNLQKISMPLDEQKPIFIQASDFKNARSTEGFQWQIIEGLGYSNESITLFPLKNYEFTQDLPFIEYNFNIEKAGTYEVEVRCLPTHANEFDHELGIQINYGSVMHYPLNTKGRSEAWKTNVLRNYQSIKMPVTFTSNGSQTLRLFVNKTGIVIDQIAVNPEDYPAYYEIKN